MHRGEIAPFASRKRLLFPKNESNLMTLMVPILSAGTLALPGRGGRARGGGGVLIMRNSFCKLNIAQNKSMDATHGIREGGAVR